MSEEVEWCIHYVDSRLNGVQSTPGHHQENLCNTLKLDKVVGPCTHLEFLGILLDTLRMELRLWSRKKCKKRELLSLIGKLAHACKGAGSSCAEPRDDHWIAHACNVVRVGRIFLRRAMG